MVAPQYTHVFDTCAVRHLCQAPSRVWVEFSERWKSQQFSTAWMPHVLAELMVTNLAARGGPSDRALRQMQRIVARFDRLAASHVLPEETVQLRLAVHDLAGAPFSTPPSTWPEVIRVFLELPSAEYLTYHRSAQGLGLTIRGDKEGTHGVDLFVPHGFIAFAQANADRMRLRLDSAPERPVAEDIASELVAMWGRIHAQLEIPLEIIESARRAPAERLFQSPLMYRMVPQNVFIHERAVGNRTGIRENDGRDLAMCSYLSDALYFVTDDRRLRELLAGVLAGPARA